MCIDDALLESQSTSNLFPHQRFSVAPGWTLAVARVESLATLITTDILASKSCDVSIVLATVHNR